MRREATDCSQRQTMLGARLQNVRLVGNQPLTKV